MPVGPRYHSCQDSAPSRRSTGNEGCLGHSALHTRRNLVCLLVKEHGKGGSRVTWVLSAAPLPLGPVAEQPGHRVRPTHLSGLGLALALTLHVSPSGLTILSHLSNPKPVVYA